MASEFYVGVKIGAAVMGTFAAAFGNARATLTGLGKAADVLGARHTRLGEVMARAMAHPTRNVGELRRQYERLGQTLDQLRAKQEKLAGSLAKGEALRQARMGMAGDMIGTWATAASVAAPVVGSVKQAVGFEAGLRDIAITGNLSRDEEVRLGKAIRDAALSTSQGHAAITQGVSTLVAQGMDAKEAGRYAGLLGKAATATNADMNDLAKMMFSLSETLDIKGEKQLKEALNRAAYGAKLGQFELKDMAGALPEMAAAFAAKGIKGQEALTQIVASLEVGRAASGSGAEAVTNLRNWLSHMNSGHTVAQYEKAGVDYKKSMQNLVADGYSSYEASLVIAQKFIAGKGEAFSKAWAEAGKKGDEEAQRKLVESFGLNEVFQDIQTINHLLAMRQGWDKYNENKTKMGGKEAQSTIDVDYARRAELAEKAFERFKTKVADLGITIGNALLPPLTSALETITPWITKIGDFAAAHPGAIRAVIGFATTVVGLKIAFLALGWGLNFFVKSPLNALGTGITTLSAKWTLLRAIFQAGSGRLGLVFQLLGFGAGTAAKLAAGVGRLGPIFRMAGQTILGFGRALLFNPIIWAVAAIGGAAYLVWKHWDSIKAAVLAGWNWLKGLASRFWQAGSELIAGLIGGITAKLGAAKDAIVGFANGIKGWFSDTLGIKSPSRVFMGFGDNVAQGAAIGISRSSGVASGAAGNMAAQTAAAANAQRTGAGMAAAGGGVSIHFNPVIHVQGGAAEGVKGQVQQAMQMSLHELEQMIKRVMAQQARRSYAGG